MKGIMTIEAGYGINMIARKSLEFMLNGGIRRLQRHGLKADGVYGKVDNLNISYDGNRMTGVLDDAGLVTQNGSMDFPVSGRETEFGYNEWGALVSDGSRGITDITYDRFGNPLKISYSDGSYTENVYSAAGEKLKATHTSTLNGTVTGKTTMEYRGNVIYRDGKADMVLFPGGYATINGTAVTFHYYTQDYLGNNRAVINGSTGAIEQTVAYYPYGGVIADLGNPHVGQPYKFGGKELITANGLNEYDFGARWYYSAVPGFTKPDPMCEEYYWLSPYLYCGNNPVNAIDPSGMVVIGLDDQARQNIIYSLSEEEAKFVRFNEEGVIDAELLNQSLSFSENYEVLRSVVNSKTSYYVATASQYNSAGRTRALREPGYELKSQGFDVNPFHDYRAVVTEGDFLPEYNMRDYISIRVDFNTLLDDQIKKVTSIGKRNFNSRMK